MKHRRPVSCIRSRTLIRRLFATAKNGMGFDNYYCWVVYFKDEVIVKARAYLDSAMVT